MGDGRYGTPLLKAVAKFMNEAGVHYAGVVAGMEQYLGKRLGGRNAAAEQLP